MERPDWVPVPAWGRLEAALRGHPAHAGDILEDLGALARHFDEPTRERLVNAFESHARCGLSPPAAVISALSDLLEGEDA